MPALGKRPSKTGWPLLRFKDVCKRDMKYAATDIESWELMVKDRSTWRHLVKEGIKHAEHMKHVTSGEEKYQKSHGHSNTTQYNFQM